MPTVIDALFVTLGLDPKGFTDNAKKVEQTQHKLQATAEDTAKRISDAGDNAAQFFEKQTVSALKLFAVLTAGQSLKSFVADQAQAAASADRMSKALGISITTLSTLEQAMTQLGSSSASVDSALSTLQKNFTSIADFPKLKNDFQNYLHINVQDANGQLKDRVELFKELHAAAKNIPTAVFRSTLQGEGFDDSLIQAFQSNDTQFNAAMASGARTAITPEQGKAGEQLGQDTTRLRQALDSSGRGLLAPLEPTGHKLAEQLETWLDNNLPDRDGKWPTTHEEAPADSKLTADDWTHIREVAAVLMGTTVATAIGGKVAFGLVKSAVGAFTGAGAMGAAGATLEGAGATLDGAATALTGSATALDEAAAALLGAARQGGGGGSPGAGGGADKPKEEPKGRAKAPAEEPKAPASEGGRGNWFKRSLRTLRGAAPVAETVAEDAVGVGLGLAATRGAGAAGAVEDVVKEAPAAEKAAVGWLGRLKDLAGGGSAAPGAPFADEPKPLPQKPVEQTPPIKPAAPPEPPAAPKATPVEAAKPVTAKAARVEPAKPLAPAAKSAAPVEKAPGGWLERLERLFRGGTTASDADDVKAAVKDGAKQGITEARAAEESVSENWFSRLWQVIKGVAPEAEVAGVDAAEGAGAAVAGVGAGPEVLGIAGVLALLGLGPRLLSLATGQGMNDEHPTYSGEHPNSANRGNTAAQREQATADATYLQSKGLTPLESAIVVGNLEQESGLDDAAYNRSSGASGLAQWLGDRQADFQKVMGTDIAHASRQQQLDFVLWELKHTERASMAVLANAKDANSDGVKFGKSYERYGAGEEGYRGSYAEDLYQHMQAANTVPVPNDNSTTHSVTLNGGLHVSTQASDPNSVSQSIASMLADPRTFAAQANRGLM